MARIHDEELRKLAQTYNTDGKPRLYEILMLRPIFYDLQLPWLIVADLPDIMT